MEVRQSTKRVGLALGLWGLMLVAVSVRLHGLPVSGMLGDSLGPWLVAWGDPLSGRAHEPLYGWGLLLPYRLALGVSGSLWEAVSVLQVFHALVAPLAAILVLLVRPGAYLAAFMAGLALALDPGLMDTARSGSEGYLGAFWIGVMLVGRAAGERSWGPGLAWCSFALAVMNHPLALCAGPFLVGLPLSSRSGRIGLGLGLLVLLPHLVHLFRAELGGSGGEALLPHEAMDAWLDTGGWVAWILLLAPVLALFRAESRFWGGCTLVSLVLMSSFGLYFGYLRDHHIRLLSLPMALCFAAFSSRYVALLLVLYRPHFVSVPPEGVAPRPGTLGMTTGLASDIEKQGLKESVLVDGVWLHGGLVAEPAGVMLDLHLRGWGLERFVPGGHRVWIVSGDRGELPVMSKHELLSRSDFHLLLLDPEELSWVCDRILREGGAWDFLALAHPEKAAEWVDLHGPVCASQ